MSAAVGHFVPALPMIKIEADGTSWLVGSRCSKCASVFTGERKACPACGSRDAPQLLKLAENGVLYNFTIVHRSYPGVTTPFVSAIVDLEGGGTLAGTLLDVEPDPAKLLRDLPVKVVFRESGQVNKEGKAFLAYYFVPARGV